jgi:sodium-coupled monocarboxylate transporter 8/12
LAGLVVFSKYYDCDPLSTNRVKAVDQLFPLFVIDTLGFIPGFVGLFVAGVFSGSLRY